MVEIQVLPEDRDGAEPYVAHQCLVARAVTRVMGQAARVGWSTVSIGFNVYDLDQRGRELRSSFDQGREVQLPCVIGMTPGI
jgi:hypothetical protein